MPTHSPGTSFCPVLVGSKKGSDSTMSKSAKNHKIETRRLLGVVDGVLLLTSSGTVSSAKRDTKTRFLILKSEDSTKAHLSISAGVYAVDLRHILAWYRKQSPTIPRFSTRISTIREDWNLLVCDREYQTGLGYHSAEGCFKDIRVIEYAIPTHLAGKSWKDLGTTDVAIAASLNGETLTMLNCDGHRIVERSVPGKWAR